MSRDNKLSLAKKRLLDHLGPEYTVKKIDSENCIYLDIGKCDIEISRGRTIKSKLPSFIKISKIGTSIVFPIIKAIENSSKAIIIMGIVNTWADKDIEKISLKYLGNL